MLLVFLNDFKNINFSQKAFPSGLRTMVQIVRRILAYQKNKLCFISILYIKNTNKECFIRSFDGLLGHELLMSFEMKNKNVHTTVHVNTLHWSAPFRNARELKPTHTASFSADFKYSSPLLC